MAEQQSGGRGVTAEGVALGATDRAGTDLPGGRPDIPVPRVLRADRLRRSAQSAADALIMRIAAVTPARAVLVLDPETSRT